MISTHIADAIAPSFSLELAIFATCTCISAGFLRNPAPPPRGLKRRPSLMEGSVKLQTEPMEGQTASFGSAAENNTTFKPHEAAGTEREARASISRYTTVKWLCWALDYAFLIVAFLFYNTLFSGEKFTPTAAALIIPINGVGLILLDLVKAFLFADVVAQAKLEHLKSLRAELGDLATVAGIKKLIGFVCRVATGEGVWREFRSKTEARRSLLHHLFYIVKIVFISVPLSSYLQVQMGLFHFMPLFETVAVIGDMKVRAIAFVYLEYLFLSFIKDALSMNVFHQIMHKQWYGLHNVHHMPMKELSVINLWFFDLPDIVIENVIAPMILLTIKLIAWEAGAGTIPQLHYLSYIFLVITDVNIHSICPYSIGFYNPILDSIMMPNISHNLHHALNVGHYTVWPWHQLKGVSSFDTKSKQNVDGSILLDMQAYDQVFKTNFAQGL